MFFKIHEFTSLTKRSCTHPLGAAFFKFLNNNNLNNNLFFSYLLVCITLVNIIFSLFLFHASYFYLALLIYLLLNSYSRHSCRLMMDEYVSLKTLFLFIIWISKTSCGFLKTESFDNMFFIHLNKPNSGVLGWPLKLLQLL